MGKPTGFMEYSRRLQPEKPPLERIRDYDTFHPAMPPELLREQAARCMNCGTPYCNLGVTWQNVASGCTLGNLIPEWNDLVYQGLYKEAWERLKLTIPFPEFTSRVCPALCEGACTCGLNDEPVTIKEIERFLSDKAFEMGWEEPQTPATRTGRTVAVIGSGPAGLTTAWRLNHFGHEVTVFEKNELPGGLLTFGIPNMKLPKQDVVMRRIRIMEAEGIVFRCNTDVTADNSAELLAGFDAVVLCCGAEAPRDHKVPGRDLEGIQFAVSFLADATRGVLDGREGEKPLAGKRVVVIGGGDTGNDCTATAIRQGADSVIQFEIMPPSPEYRAANNPWPRWPFVKKTDYGQQEAIAVWGDDPRQYCVQTLEFTGDKQVKELHTVQVEWVVRDGRRVPQNIAGTERTVSADLVLLAMGFTGARDYTKQLAEGKGPAEGFFTCGDMRTGQSLVVKAMADGMHCAEQVDGYLSRL